MSRIPPELSTTARQDIESPLARLAQGINIAKIDSLGFGEWTTLYEYQKSADESICFYSALLTPQKLANAIRQFSWDLLIGDGAPGFSQQYDNGTVVTTFERVGANGIEPILFVRNFHGVKPRQFDLNEEFRLFHNLYHDRQTDRYIYIDDRGDETIAAESNAGAFRVLTRLLRQYMAARQLVLVLFFDHRVHADIDVKSATAAIQSGETLTADRCYSFYVGEVMGRTFSRLFGKKIIKPSPISECGVWPFEAQADEPQEFIIGVGDDGSPIMYSCDHENLANYFGANEHAPNYLTPVWFTRDVLAKYYDNPEKFSVEDGYLRCGELWGIQIDNNLPDYVVVYLGDLGRDLDRKEQIYWKHFNVPPKGGRSSEANFRRSFLGEFTDPTAPDLIFKNHYVELIEAWTKKFGWPLFRPLHNADKHILKQIRIPLTESGSEFESLILFLSKLLVDSLNEKELAAACGGALPAEKGLGKLERYLSKQNYPWVERDIKILRTLQGLRSSGVAHAKGKIFDKVQIEVGLDRSSPRAIFYDFLVSINQMLVDLSAHFLAPPKH